MKVFISQPMKGRSNAEILAEREPLIRELEQRGFEVIDSIMDIPGASRLEYLAESIKLIDKADAVVFMKGWTEAVGCNIEYEVAVRYGKFIKII